MTVVRSMLCMDRDQSQQPPAEPRPWPITLISAVYMLIGAAGFVGCVYLTNIALSNDSSFNVVVGLIFSILGLTVFAITFASAHMFAKRGVPALINSVAAIYMLVALPLALGLVTHIGEYGWQMVVLALVLMILALGLPQLIRLPVNRPWLAVKAEQQAARALDANRRFASSRLAAATRKLTGEPLPTDPPDVRAAWLAEQARRRGETT